MAADKPDVPTFDPPNPNRIYRDYLLTCRRLGITPTPQEQAKALFEERTNALAARSSGREMPAMEERLSAIAAALARLTDAELDALTQASNRSPQIAPGLLAWIDSACNGEWNRRTGRPYELRPPEAAIDPFENQISIGAALMLRATFDCGPVAAGALKFFDALLALLTGGDRKH